MRLRPFFSSLRGRIFLASALLAVLSIGVAIYLVNVQFTREAEATLQREIVTTAALVDDLRATRTQTFAQMARFIADAPKVKAAVDTNDPPTVQDLVTQDYRDQLQSNVLLVTNRAGRPLAIVGTPPAGGVLEATGPAVRDALLGHERFSLLAQSDGMLQLVTVPITIGLERPEILGTVSIGFLLDSALAGRLKEITGSDIAFAMDGQVRAATLPRDTFGLLSSRLDATEVSHLRVGGEEFLVLPRRLASAGQQPQGSVPVALILRSRTELLRGLQTIHTGLALTAVLAVLLATVLGFAVAGTITRPLGNITRVMREVSATGDLTRKIALREGRWNDEDARLLATTFNALTESIARFQRQMSQKERLTSLGRLSTVIAHEIRNPLMIIKAALHTLRQGDVSSAAVREAVEDIDEEVVRLNRIVNEVLDFSRPIRFDLAPTDLAALCRESAAAASASPGQPVALDLQPGLPAIETDAERLRIALVNMLDNARQASREPVVLKAAAAEGRVRLAIVDHGTGIAPADLPHVFDPYFTTRRGGTGLGLPIAKNIVEGLGGTLTVSSVVGRGTQVSIELPARVPVPTGAA
jgi:signal transduction histidine kinase